MPQIDGQSAGLAEQAVAVLTANQNNLLNFLSSLEKSQAENGASPAPDAADALQTGLRLLLEHTRLLSRQLAEGRLPAPEELPTLLSSIDVLRLQEEDRAVTAKNLEESSGQLLANAIFELVAVRQLISDNSNQSLVIDGLTALQEELEAGLANLRFLVANLEPSTILGNFGLVAGLRRYLEKFSEVTGSPVNLQVNTVIDPLPATIETAIFRVLQEALYNAHQHANASEIGLIVSDENGQLKFEISDDGTGVAPDLNHPSRRRLGLVNATELAALLHGSLSIKSEPDKGTLVTLIVPYPKF